MDKKLYEEGLAVRREVLGAEHVDRSIANADAFPPVRWLQISAGGPGSSDPGVSILRDNSDMTVGASP